MLFNSNHLSYIINIITTYYIIVPMLKCLTVIILFQFYIEIFFFINSFNV